MDTIPGNPVKLDGSISEFSAASRAILEVTQQLESIAADSVSDALEAIDGLVVSTNARMRSANERYTHTVGTLRTYQVVLAEAQPDADDAIFRAGRAQENASTAERNAETQATLAKGYEDAGVSPDLAARHRTDEQYFRGRVAVHDRSYQDALADRTAAFSRYQTAAEAAAADLKDIAFDGTTDTNADRLGNVKDFITEKWDAFTQWIDDILSSIVDFIRTVLGEIFNALASVLLLVLLLTAAVAFLGLLIAFPVQTIAALLVLFALDSVFDDLTGLIAIVVPLVMSLPVIEQMIMLYIWKDAIKPDPDVTVWQPTPGELHEERAHAYLNMGPPESTNDMIRRLGYVDDAGGEGMTDERGVIDITSVIGPDGIERFIVTLPSTQEGLLSALGLDAGATNDWSGNLGLMYGEPGSTQYERALRDALRQAGIGPNDPVVFAGFSQGGIAAARMASTAGDDFNVHGILAVGSPIDGFDIPPGVKVVSLENNRDLVHQADGISGVPNSADRLTITGTTVHDRFDAHGTRDYQDLLSQSGQAGAVDDIFRDFLVPEGGLESGDYRSASIQYTWSE